MIVSLKSVTTSGTKSTTPPFSGWARSPGSGAFQPIGKLPAAPDTPLFPSGLRKTDARSYRRRAEYKLADHPCHQSERAPGRRGTPSPLVGLWFSPSAPTPYVRLTVTVHPQPPALKLFLGFASRWGSPLGAAFGRKAGHVSPA